MNLDKITTREELARELGLDASGVNFQWEVEQKTANWPATEAQQIRNKFFPKIIGSGGKLNLHLPVLVFKKRREQN
jgi:hypothetical protein